jgi:2-hydroxychromene-2-carboxylate isomerase
LEAAESEAIKARLRANTAAAVAAGAAGVPTFVVDDTILIWGVDRLDHVEAALAGWRPAHG